MNIKSNENASRSYNLSIYHFSFHILPFFPLFSIKKIKKKLSLNWKTEIFFSWQVQTIFSFEYTILIHLESSKTTRKVVKNFNLVGVKEILGKLVFCFILENQIFCNIFLKIKKSFWDPSILDKLNKRNRKGLKSYTPICSFSESVRFSGFLRF